MPYPHQPWRDAWQPASFKGAGFHVETDARASGRRIALHEFPKRNDPYAEDMGKRAVKHQVTGYIITSPQQPDYRPDRNRLINALESDGPGILVHPLLPQMKVMCETYTVTESRDKGGFCVFEMQFVEAGSALPGVGSAVNTTALVNGSAGSANQAIITSTRNSLGFWV